MRERSSVSYRPTVEADRLSTPAEFRAFFLPSACLDLHPIRRVGEPEWVTKQIKMIVY
jgi:hypothetical protein